MINIFFLFNVVSFVNSIEIIVDNRKTLREIYDAIGEIDTNISISNYLSSLDQYCIANFNTNNMFELRSIVHPLIKDPVANSFNVDNKSILITGSNMAGKTSFIKTIAVNLILSKTLSFCLASEANFPDLIVKSFINRSDDLNDQKSYYFKEVEAIEEFITLSEQRKTYLFLIDEIFRGTNTVERISSATSVLNHISKTNLIFCTTHDIELQHLLKNFMMYHFTDQVINNEYSFSYKLLEGPSKTRNAIKLLEIMGYPESIITDAKEIADKLN